MEAARSIADNGSIPEQGHNIANARKEHEFILNPQQSNLPAEEINLDRLDFKKLCARAEAVIRDIPDKGEQEKQLQTLEGNYKEFLEEGSIPKEAEKCGQFRGWIKALLEEQAQSRNKVANPLNSSQSNFNTLAQYAGYLVTPKFHDNIQRILYQLAERLSNQPGLTAEDEKSSTDAYALFFRQMHTLVAHGIIPKEDLSAIFIRVLLVALHNKAFFLEIISFIKGDANLSPEELRDVFAQVIISALQYKVPNEKIIHFMEEVKKEFYIDVKTQCADLLQKVPYTHYAQLNKLLGCLVGTIEVKEGQTVTMIEKYELKKIIETQARKLLKSNDYTAYLRLIRLSDSALNLKIDLYDRGSNEALMRRKREGVASVLGSLSSINPGRIENFRSLKAASAKGDPYASFFLMQLYYKGHAIREDGKSRYEDKSLALIYAQIATAQAKALGNQGLIAEIQSFLGVDTRILCLEELYYMYLLTLLNTPVKSKDYPLVKGTFLLIITSVDLEMVFDHEYESKSKTEVQKLINQCYFEKNVDRAEALLRICDLMQEKGAYIQSSGGNARAADPRNLSIAVRYNLHYQWLLAQLKNIALLKPSSITVQDLYRRLRQAAGAKGSEVADNLKHVYKHLYGYFLYDTSIDNDDEILTKLFKSICEKENVSLDIRAPNSPFIAGSDKSAAKGKEKEDPKGKEEEGSEEEEDFEEEEDSKGKEEEGSEEEEPENDVFTDLHGYSVAWSSSSVASSSIGVTSSSSSVPADVFVRRNLNGQPYTMRSSRRDVSDSPNTFIHSAGSSSSSSRNLSSDSARTTRGARLIDTLSYGLSTLFATPVGGGAVVISTSPPISVNSVNVDDILSDVVNLDRDYGAAIARPLTEILPEERPKKITLIGDSAVGKSCLLLRLVDDTYTESFICTIGVDFKQHTATVGGQMFRANIWDLCGQERFRSITHSYHAAASIVLCFDLSDPISFANIIGWCGEVGRYAPPNTRVILIGTKCDMVRERQISYEIARNFADRLGIYYLEISARDSVNIERLGALIALAPYSQREQHLESARDYDMGAFRQSRFGL